MSPDTVTIVVYAVGGIVLCLVLPPLLRVRVPDLTTLGARVLVAGTVAVWWPPAVAGGLVLAIVNSRRGLATRPRAAATGALLFGGALALQIWLARTIPPTASITGVVLSACVWSPLAGAMLALALDPYKDPGRSRR